MLASLLLMLAASFSQAAPADGGPFGGDGPWDLAVARGRFSQARKPTPGELLGRWRSMGSINEAGVWLATPELGGTERRYWDLWIRRIEGAESDADAAGTFINGSDRGRPWGPSMRVNHDLDPKSAVLTRTWRSSLRAPMQREIVECRIAKNGYLLCLERSYAPNDAPKPKGWIYRGLRKLGKAAKP